MTVFALVPRTRLKQRLDVNYALGGDSRTSQRATVPLGDVLLEIRYGTSQKATLEPVGVPVLRMGNVRDGSLDVGSVKFVELPPAERERLLLRPGDLVVNRTNTKELVGKAALFDLAGDWVFASYLLRLRVDERRVLPAYVNAWLATDDARAQINQSSRQAAGMTNINTSELRNLRLPVPTLTMQRQLVKPIQAARKQRDTLMMQSLHKRASVEGAFLSTTSLPRILPAESTLHHGYDVKRNLLRHNLRLDVAFFHPERVAAISAVARVPHARLGDLASLRRGSSEAEGPIIGLADLESHTGHLRSIGTAEEEAGSPTPGGVQSFEPGDILYGRLRPNLNKVWVAERKGLCSPEFRVLQATSMVSSRYLAIALRSSYTLAQTVHATSGNTHPRIRDEDLLDVLIPTPPTDVQHQLVSQVEQYLVSARNRIDKATSVWESAKRDFERAVTRLSYDS